MVSFFNGEKNQIWFKYDKNKAASVNFLILKLQIYFYSFSKC